jgi:ubiquinone/menaquinone biosynthesis C-methylase UbiE
MDHPGSQEIGEPARMRTLTLEEAKAYYDGFGAKQDSQSFYEGPAIKVLIGNSHFDQAGSVFEFGCGTGHFAQELFTEHLSPDAKYRSIDISTTMIQLATERLKPFEPRAMITQTFDETAISLDDNSIDRFVSTYVFDLLPQASAQKVLAQAHRALQVDSLLCLVSIAPGTTPISRFVMGTWQWIFSQKPSLVGGCRPTQLAELLPTAQWQIQFQAVLVAWGIASEVMIAAPIKV